MPPKSRAAAPRRPAPARSIARQHQPDNGAGDHAHPSERFQLRYRDSQLARAHVRATQDQVLALSSPAGDPRALLDAARQLVALIEDPELEGLMGERYANTALPRAYVHSIEAEVLDPVNVPAHDPCALSDAARALADVLDELAAREGA